MFVCAVPDEASGLWIRAKGIMHSNPQALDLEHNVKQPGDCSYLSL